MSVDKKAEDGILITCKRANCTPNILIRYSFSKINFISSLMGKRKVHLFCISAIHLYDFLRGTTQHISSRKRSSGSQTGLSPLLTD